MLPLSITQLVTHEQGCVNFDGGVCIPGKQIHRNDPLGLTLDRFVILLHGGIHDVIAIQSGQ